MPSTLAEFKIDCETPMLVSDVRRLLDAMQGAYDGLIAFELIAQDLADRSTRLRRFVPFPLDFHLGALWVPEGVISSELVPPDDALALSRAQLSSPGFLEFLGSLNPLEQIRRYLNDRHQRKLDWQREPERQREGRLSNDNLELQNEKLALANLRELLQLERDFEIPDSQLRLMYRRYAGGQMRALGEAVDVLDAQPGELAIVSEN
jgi:hypothetical protein